MDEDKQQSNGNSGQTSTRSEETNTHIGQLIRSNPIEIPVPKVTLNVNQCRGVYQRLYNETPSDSSTSYLRKSASRK